MDEMLTRIERQLFSDPENIYLRKLLDAHLVRVAQEPLELKLIGDNVYHIYDEETNTLCEHKRRYYFPRMKDVSGWPVCIRCCVLYCEEQPRLISKFNNIRQPTITSKERKEHWASRLEAIINAKQTREERAAQQD